MFLTVGLIIFMFLHGTLRRIFQKTSVKCEALHLKGQISQKWQFCDHLLTLMSSQPCMNDFFLWKTKTETSKNGLFVSYNKLMVIQAANWYE